MSASAAAAAESFSQLRRVALLLAPFSKQPSLVTICCLVSIGPVLGLLTVALPTLLFWSDKTLDALEEPTVAELAEACVFEEVPPASGWTVEAMQGPITDGCAVVAAAGRIAGEATGEFCGGLKKNRPK